MISKYLYLSSQTNTLCLILFILYSFDKKQLIILIHISLLFKHLQSNRKNLKKYVSVLKSGSLESSETKILLVIMPLLLTKHLFVP